LAGRFIRGLPPLAVEVPGLWHVCGTELCQPGERSLLIFPGHGEDLRHLSADPLVGLNGGMFVGDGLLLDVSFGAARARLANLIRGGSLVIVSKDAYDDGITSLIRVGLLGSAPDVSRLAEAHFRDLVAHDGFAVLSLRWEAAGPGGGRFPALDADITLTPAGEQATLLTLAGAYRPPLSPVGAALGRAILHCVAELTIRIFINHVADGIAHPVRAADLGRGNAGTNPPSPLPAPEAP